MKIKSQKDFWSGLLFIVTGLGFAAGALNYTLGSSAQPGPGFFPLGLGVLLALLGALVLFKSLSVEAEGGDPIGHFPWKALLVITLSVVLFGFALQPLGLLVTLPLLVVLSAWAGDRFHWRSVLASALVLTAGSWLVLIKGLNLVIPLWPAFISA